MTAVDRKLKLVVVTGLSGAGKSVAMHALEDLGYYCVDNLPVSLLLAFASELDKSAADAEPGSWRVERAAVGIDARNPGKMLHQLPGMITGLRAQGVVSDLLFLEASDHVLIERFSETRRKHPLTSDQASLPEAIRRERALLAPVKLLADGSIDTTRMNLHQLRDRIWTRVDQRAQGRLSTLFLSFGYKFGLPHDADMVFDVRCLPNPHWEPGLRPLTGKDEAVARFLGAHTIVTDYLDTVCRFLERWIPAFEADNRSYLTIAIGCTGGRHRSVFLVEQLATRFSGRCASVIARHRELE